MLFLMVTISTLPYSLAFPGYYHGNHKLQSVPNEESFGKIQYPHLDIIEFGDIRKNNIPPKMIHEIKKILIKEPKPYPVKVPHPVPYPVYQKVPIHLVNQEIVKVPKPVPYPVFQAVSIPIQVPRAYPVPFDEFKGISPGSGGDYGGDSSEINRVNNVEQSYPIQENDIGRPLGLEQYGKLNELINYQDIQEDSQRNQSNGKPVYEDQKEEGAS